MSIRQEALERLSEQYRGRFPDATPFHVGAYEYEARKIVDDLIDADVILIFD